MPNPVSQHWPVSKFTRTLAGLMSLWITAALMQVTNRGRKANGQTQRKRYVQWSTEQSIEGHTAGILQHKYRTVPVASHCNRSGSPRWGPTLLSENMRAPVVSDFPAWDTPPTGESTRTFTGSVLTPPAIKDKLFILPQRLEDISR